MKFDEIGESEKLKGEAFSSRYEREILSILYNFREINPLRPKDMLDYLPERLSSSDSKLAYHLDKLFRAGLIERKRAGRKFSWYRLTNEGIDFYEKLPRKSTPEDAVIFLADIVAPYAKGVSKAEIAKHLRDILSAKEVTITVQKRRNS